MPRMRFFIVEPEQGVRFPFIGPDGGRKFPFVGAPDSPTTTGQPGAPDGSRSNDLDLKELVVPVTW